MMPTWKGWRLTNAPERLQVLKRTEKGLTEKCCNFASLTDSLRSRLLYCRHIA